MDFEVLQGGGRSWHGREASLSRGGGTSRRSADKMMGKLDD